MKNFITRIGDAISYPFSFFAALLEESRNLNEDGSWDKYWARKNCRAALRDLKAEYKQNRKNIKAFWRVEK